MTKNLKNRFNFDKNKKIKNPQKKFKGSDSYSEVKH